MKKLFDSLASTQGEKAGVGSFRDNSYMIEGLQPLAGCLFQLTQEEVAADPHEAILERLNKSTEKSASYLLRWYARGGVQEKFRSLLEWYFDPNLRMLVRIDGGFNARAAGLAHGKKLDTLEWLTIKAGGILPRLDGGRSVFMLTPQEFKRRSGVLVARRERIMRMGTNGEPPGPPRRTKQERRATGDTRNRGTLENRHRNTSSLGVIALVPPRWIPTAADTLASMTQEAAWGTLNYRQSDKEFNDLLVEIQKRFGGTFTLAYKQPFDTEKMVRTGDGMAGLLRMVEAIRWFSLSPTARKERSLRDCLSEIEAPPSEEHRKRWIWYTGKVLP